jgi:hypothetical protein
MTHSLIPPRRSFGEIANVIRVCTSLVASSPTATQILDMPWVADEQPVWVKEFRTGSRTASVDKLKGLSWLTAYRFKFEG